MPDNSTDPSTAGHPVLPRPLPRLKGPFQPGVSDPVWPEETPCGFDASIYQANYAGRVDRQRHLHIITIDVTVTTRCELVKLLSRLTDFARHEMSKKPSTTDARPYDQTTASRRVTVTVGFGATLFTTIQGDDRFGLAGLRPNCLKVIPASEGDDQFDPRQHAADLVVLASSDDLYVNEYILGKLFYKGVHPGIEIRRVDRGYSRPDNREPSGFEDGLTNPTDQTPQHLLRHLVYVQPTDGEPDWCVNGTYLGYRKVQRQLRHFFQLSDAQREAVFGTHRTTGNRLSNPSKSSHSMKMNPKRPTPDLFGILEESRRFYRRPYFYDDGLDGDKELRGLLHLSFARNLATQYEWPVHMWQMNANFPNAGDGRDALYTIGGAANICGGYFFIPAASRDYLGVGLFS